MEGNTIYLLFQQDLHNGGTELIAPYATFDGVLSRIETEREYWEKKGMSLQRNINGSLFVKDMREPLYYYFVSSRTILD